MKINQFIADECEAEKAKEKLIAKRKEMELLLSRPPMLPSELEAEVIEPSAAQPAESTETMEGLSEMVDALFQSETAQDDFSMSMPVEDAPPFPNEELDEEEEESATDPPSEAAPAPPPPVLKVRPIPPPRKDLANK